MKKFLLFLLVLIIALVVASQFLLPSFIGSRIESQLNETLKPTAQTVNVEAQPAFKILYGEVDRVYGTLENIKLGKLNFASFRFDAKQILVNPISLLASQQIDIVSVGNTSIDGTINKADLGKKVDLEGIEISAKEQDILALTKEIKKKFNLGLISNQEEYYLTNARQTQLLEKAAVSLQSAIDAMKMSIPADLIVEDLYDSWSCLKEILGEQAKEDLLDELFKRFCIGK